LLNRNKHFNNFVGREAIAEELEMINEAIMQARAEGIVDVDSYPYNASIDTIKLAADLMRKHGPELYRRLEERRKEQELRPIL
jgi:DNA-binding transcriptional regulator LsrR (DeoR family)